MPKYTAKIKATGVDGSAAGGPVAFNGGAGVGTLITGYLEEVSYKFNVDADTSDLTLYVLRNGAEVNVFTQTNTDGSGVNVTRYPRHVIHTEAGVLVEEDTGNVGRGEERFYFAKEKVYAKVAQTDANATAPNYSVEVEMFVSPY